MADTQSLSPSDPRTLGRYELLGRLGAGSQGIVFLARDPADGTLVAVKLLHALLSENETSRSRFLREVDAAKRVPRFCTAQLLNADLADARPYIVSEYIPGPSLEAVVRSEGPRGATALERIAVNTATALAGIHQAGIVHRDYKAANVLLGPDGPVVIDFGIARVLDAIDSRLTLPGHAAGTPGYMAPDQFEDGGAGPAADIFAWGVTMTYAATGTLPFGSGSVPAIIYRILNQPPQLDGLPPSLHGLVAACLDKDPASRPTAREVIDHLLGREQFSTAPSPQAPRPAAGSPAPGDIPADGSVRVSGMGSTQDAGTPPDPAPSLDGTPSFDSAPSLNGTPSFGSVPSLDGTPSFDSAPSLTVDPIRAVQMHQSPQPFDFGEPPASKEARPSRSRRVPVWAAIASAAALVAAGVVAVSAFSGSPSGSSPSLSADTSTTPGVSALGPLPAAGASRQAKHSTTGTGRKKAHAGTSGRTAAATGGYTPAAQKSSVSTHPAAHNSQTAVSVPTTAASPTAKATPTAKASASASPSPPAPSPSQPAGTPNPYTAAEACGSGYSVIDSHSLSGGTVYLLWNNSTGKNCVATMRTLVSGKIAMQATLSVQGGQSASDSGDYSYYAGPVALQAVATCVEWGGSIGSSSWTSGWSHCS